MGYLPKKRHRAHALARALTAYWRFVVDNTGSGLKHEYFSSILDSLKVESERRGYDITFIAKKGIEFSMDYYEHAKYRNCDGDGHRLGRFSDPRYASSSQAKSRPYRWILFTNIAVPPCWG